MQDWHRSRSLLALCALGAFASLPGCDATSAQAPHVPEPELSPCSVMLEGGRVSTLPLPEGAAAVCHEATSAELATAADLQVTGHLPISPALTLRLDQPPGVRGVEVLLPISRSRIAQLPAPLSNPARVLSPERRAHLVVLARFGKAPPHLLALTNAAIAWTDSGDGAGQLRFRLPAHEIAPLAQKGALGEIGTFQVAVPASLGIERPRRYTYRVIGGVSMGGIGSSMTFFRNPDLFDAIGVMGADPGPDLTYSQGFIRDFFFGGFCTVEDERAGRGKVGMLCPTARKPLAGQGELVGDFEHMPMQKGEGIGLTLSRALFLRANRDLVRALGNWAYHTPDDPSGYLPPGVPLSTLALSPNEACTRPTVLRGRDRGGQTPFYDGRYNPEGKHDVITFCDAETESNGSGHTGVFDGNKAARDPAQILLAVDMNGNGRRDAGEPVIIQVSEPFDDVGADGLPSQREPGYDPVTNPDPSGDDYHYLKNPGGAEGNWRRDEGEPFVDAGLNGVRCASGSAPAGCFDYGEGNGKFDVNPNVRRWLEHDPRTLLEGMSDDQLDRVDIYYDAGVRDFFNAGVSTNSLMGALLARGRGVRTFDTFPALQDLPPSAEGRYDGRGVDLNCLGRRAYVRYGNPLISDADAADTGDGRHVGTPIQVINRAITLFWWMLNRWPDADRTSLDGDDERLNPKGLMITQKSGRATPYNIILPPGYYEPENQELRYPIAYFMHGLGQEPEDLASIGAIMHLFMADPEPSRRLPKAILVFLDGRCRPGGQITQGPLPQAGDRCETGSFYTDHRDGIYRGQQMFLELDEHMRRAYRVRAPME